MTCKLTRRVESNRERVQQGIDELSQHPRENSKFTTSSANTGTSRTPIYLCKYQESRRFNDLRRSLAEENLPRPTHCSAVLRYHAESPAL
ncbi:hypothetical protein RRG08_062860 [Elysia crispata]|uniref:Uncharacterized protein n=1 Tax=Elysia crispata TaxID=231223 RepID=A0AAE1A395_9GAST|nr:hypothetical protein RRG08_062860 [Elysia crispata]